VKFLNNVDANDNSFLLTNAQISSAELVVSSTDSAELYSFSKEFFRSAKFVIQTVSSSGFSFSFSTRELLAIHDDVSGFLTEYAIVGTSEFLEKDEFSFSLVNNEAVLSVKPTTLDSRNIKVHVTLFPDYEFINGG